MDCHQPNLVSSPMALVSVSRVAATGLLCILMVRSPIYISCALCSQQLPRVGQDLTFCPHTQLLLYEDMLSAGESDFCLMSFFPAKVFTCSLTLSSYKWLDCLLCHLKYNGLA